MKPKKMMTRKDQINYWIEQYLQAKLNGDTTRMKMFESVIIKLGGKVPKL